MGPSQGRHSAVAAVRVLARETGTDLAELCASPPSARPTRRRNSAIWPAAIFEPERHTAMHHRHLELGARMMAGRHLVAPGLSTARPEQRDQAIREEVLAVRNNVGLIDVSTLGGLDVRGPDAAEFLNRMYTFTYAKQPVGPLALCADDRPDRRHHRRRRRLPAPRRAFLRHRHHQRRRRRLSPDAAMERAVAAGRRHRQRHRRLCRGEHRRAELARGAAEGLPRRRSRRRRRSPIWACAWARSPASRRGCCASASSANSATRSTCPASQGEALWDALMAAGRHGRHPALRRRGPARAAAGEGPHHHRPGHRRADPSLRGRHGLGDRPRPSLISSAAARSRSRRARPLTRKLVGFTLDDPAAAGAGGMPPDGTRRRRSSAASPRRCARPRSAR